MEEDKKFIDKEIIEMIKLKDNLVDIASNGKRLKEEGIERLEKSKALINNKPKIDQIGFVNED